MARLGVNLGRAMLLDSCMGGFCHVRDRCAFHAHATEDILPRQRMCPTGKEQPLEGAEIVFWAMAQERENKHQPTTRSGHGQTHY